MPLNIRLIRRTFWVFLLAGLPVGIILFLVFSNMVDTAWNERKFEERNKLDAYKTTLLNYLSSTISDLFIVRDIPAFQRYINDKNFDELFSAQEAYRIISLYSGLYDQIRYIDNEGMEEIRVNFGNNQTTVVSSAMLQDNSNRDFYQQTMRMSSGDLYISRMDLNLEREKIEIPYKPTIRYSTPVFDRRGDRSGLVVLNFLAENIFMGFRELDRIGETHTYLLNDGAWYLYNSVDPTCTFGFMFTDSRSNCLFSIQFPDEWEQIQQAHEGQFETARGLVTFEKLTPTQGISNKRVLSLTTKVTEPNWILVTIYPKTKISYSSAVVSPFTWLIGMIALLMVFGAYFLASRLEQRGQVRKQLEHDALHDSLTGLPNRVLLRERLAHDLARANRDKIHLAVFFLDLDGFKEINDKYGHEAGDFLLTQLGNALVTSLRESDTIARLGGDEFCIIATGIHKMNDVQLIAQKILDLVSVPVLFREQTLAVSGSLGICIPELGNMDQDLILDVADDAMYEAKRQGKNRYVVGEGADL